MADMESIAAGEFAFVELGDQRLNVRAAAIASKLSQSPAVGFPKVLSETELSGYYRFVNNESVSFESLLEAHVESTKRRVELLRRVVVAHDTSDCRYTDEQAREGLGPMDNGGQGFYFHASVAFDQDRRPLGTVAIETWVRSPQDPTAPKPTQKQRYESPDKESLRWMRAVHRTALELAGTGAELVHVMDREADDYDILCELVEHQYLFVVRASTDRSLSEEHLGEKLKPFARNLEVRVERSAKLAHRKKKRPAKEVRKFPPRKTRDARLSFSAGRVTLRRPDKANKSLPAELELNVVHVIELNPPEDCEPVEWFLLTNQPVDTDEQILRIVDDYRTRWGIEEFFKALKTGCNFEGRQHESLHALLNALAIFLAIAWGLMTLRHAARDPQTKDLPATEVLTPRQIEILRVRSHGKLGATPTVYEAIMALARFFGGHIRGNGDPGWQVLGRAYESLLLVEFGWWLATQAAIRV
jgi:hypothetical protein